MRRLAVMAILGALALFGCSAGDSSQSADPSTAQGSGSEGEAPCPAVTSAPAEPVKAGLLPEPIPALSPGNPFTTPLPEDDVPLLPRGEQDAFRDELRFFLQQGVQVEQHEFSASLFIVRSNGDVYDTAGRKQASGAPFVRPTGPISELNAGIDGRGWPLQSWMQPDPGEQHMALYNPDTGAYGEFIGAQVSDGKLEYRWGGFIPDTRRSDGTSTWRDPWWGATAFGLNLMSFTITDQEIRDAVERYKAGDYENAYIPHVIGYEAYRHHPNQWHYPASKTDDVGGDDELEVPEWGTGGDYDRLGHGTGVLPMGGLMRLKPSVDVQAEVRGDGTDFGDMMARIIARTLQEHGATMTDQSKSGFALLAEHVREPDGTFDEDSFDYGRQNGEDGKRWLTPLLWQLVDEEWVQFVNTGRHLEADTGQPPPGGAYRPPERPRAACAS